MKVLSYLELNIKTEYAVDYYPENIFNLMETYDSVATFYSQSFEPNMITKYFKYWKFDRGRYSYIDNELIFYNANYRIGKHNSYYAIYPHFPRTLDDFINDCQRAGIELEWKEDLC